MSFPGQKHARGIQKQTFHDCNQPISAPYRNQSFDLQHKLNDLSLYEMQQLVEMG